MFVNVNSANIEVFLDQVHQRMIKKYTSKLNVQQEEKTARDLQSFLQSLKNRSNQKKGFLPITNSYADAVIEELYQRAPGTKRNGLFMSKGGSSLEYDLANVIDTVYALTLQRYEGKGRNYIVGNVRGTVLQGVLNDTIKDISVELQDEVKKTLSKDAKVAMGLDPQKSLLVDVQGKTDVQGGFINIRFQPTSYLEYIASILNEATFSAKNYSSLSSKMEDLNSKFPELHIGSSSPYRPYAGALASLGYDEDTIQQSFISAYYGRRSAVLKAHIWHLRAIYEYSGAGIINIDGTKAREVKYLVYNDPTGSNIYVESVASIILQYLNTMDNIEDPFAAINIKKDYFKQH